MKCPDCNREMRVKTSRTPEGAWTCDYCSATWTRVDSIHETLNQEQSCEDTTEEKKP